MARNVSVFVNGSTLVAHIVPVDGGWRVAPVTGPRVETVFDSPEDAVADLGAGSLLAEDEWLGLVE